MFGTYQSKSNQCLAVVNQKDKDLKREPTNSNELQSHSSQLIPLTEQDRDYLTYFRDVFLDGKKYSIQKDKDWKQMPDNDLRRQVYCLLEDMLKKNKNLGVQLNKINQINHDKTKQSSFYDSIYQFFNHLEQQNFYIASRTTQKNLSQFPKLFQLLSSISKRFQKLKCTQLNFEKLQKSIEKYCQIKRNQSASKSNTVNFQTTVYPSNSTKDENLSCKQLQFNKDDQKYYQKIKDLQSSINKYFQSIMQRAIKITTRGNKSLQINQLKFQQLRQNILSKLNQGLLQSKKSSQKSLISGQDAYQEKLKKLQHQSNKNINLIEDLKSQNKQKQDEITTLRIDNKNMKNGLIEYQQKYSQSLNQIALLKTIIKQLQENKQTLEKQIKQKTQTINEILKQQQKKKLQDKITKLHNLCNQKDIQIISLKQLVQQQYNKQQKEKNKTQTQLITQINRLKYKLNRSLLENEGLISQITCLNGKITEKNNEVFLKESQIRALKKKQQQFNSKIAKCEEIIGEKDQKLQKITNQLKEKQMLIKDPETKNLQKNSQTTIEVIPEEKIKQSEEQQRKPIIQTKTANFRSFNNRQKSNTKNITSNNKVTKSPIKSSPLIQKINHQSHKNQIDKKQRFKIQPKVFSQTLIPEIKQKIRQFQDQSITNGNKIKKQYPHIDNKLNQIQSLKKKSQSQWNNQVKQKQSRIGSLNSQIISLNSTIQQLNKRVEEIQKQNSSHKQEIENLIKSNQKFREQQRKSLELQSEIKKIKEQKQQIEKKIQQTKKELQKHKSLAQQMLFQQHDSIQLKQLRFNFKQKCKHIKKLQKTNNDLTQQVSNLQKDKLTLQMTIQSLKIQQKETAPKNEKKLEIKSAANLINKTEQNNAQLQAYKKQMIVKILQLELDLDQKQQNYQELKEKSKKQITALKNQIQTLSSSTPGLQSEISNLKNELLKKQSALNNKQKEVESLHAKISELQTLMQKQNEDISKFEEQIKDLKKENDSMERQITRLCDGRDKLESENNSLIDKYRNQQKLHKEQIDKMKKDQAAQIRSLRFENARQVQEVRRQIKSAQYSQRIKSNTENGKKNCNCQKNSHDPRQQALNVMKKERNQFEQENRKLREQLIQQKQILQSKKEEMKMTMQKAIQDLMSQIN